MRYRLDDEDPEQVELRRSGSTLTFADSEEMLWRLHDASTLRVEVDARVGDVDVIVFDLMGAREVVRSVREACGW